MALAKTFEAYRLSPEWAEFSYDEKRKLRKAWVMEMGRATGKANDPAFINKLVADAYSDAPYQIEADMGIAPEQHWGVRNPRLWGAAKTATEAPLTALRMPQQLIANILAPILGTAPKAEELESLPAPIKSLLYPVYQSGKQAISGGLEEPTELPGGVVSSLVTDPLMWTGIGETVGGLRFGREAARMAKQGVKMVPPLKPGIPGLQIPKIRKARAVEEYQGIYKTPGEMTELMQAFPSFGRLNKIQRKLYSEATKVGKQYFTPDELKEFAMTIAQSRPREAAAMINRVVGLGEKVAEKTLSLAERRKEINAIKQWFKSRHWERPRTWGEKAKEEFIKSRMPGAKKAGKKAAEAGEAVEEVAPAGSVPEEMNILNPEEYVNMLLQEPEELALW